MNRWLYAALLALCLVTLALQVIGFPGYRSALEAASPGTVPQLPTITQVAAVTGLVSWLLGIGLTASRRQWAWLAATIFLSYLAAGVYAAVQLWRHAR